MAEPVGGKGVEIDESMVIQKAPKEAETGTFLIADELELLRLRVLATRKRGLKTENDREEGEVSESDQAQERKRLLPLPFSFGNIPFRRAVFPSRRESHFSDSAKTARSRKKNKARKAPLLHDFEPLGEACSHTDRFFGSLSMDMEAEPGLSRTFQPQSCSIVLDSDTDEEAEPVSHPPILPLDCANVEPKLLRSPTLGKVAQDIFVKEFLKQKHLLSTARAKLELLNTEKASLQSQYSENEDHIKNAVDKQQNLKAQLKSVKDLIKKCKDLRGDYSLRKVNVEKEIKANDKLVQQLETSIHAKTSSPLVATLSPPSPPPNDVDNAVRGKVMEDSADSLPTPRATIISQLEKQTLRVKEDLVAAQLCLLQKRSLHAKKNASLAKIRPNGYGNSMTALGKVLSLTPFQASSIHQASSPNHALNDSKFDELLLPYFPERMFIMHRYALDTDCLKNILGSFIELSKLNIRYETLESSVLSLPLSAEPFDQYSNAQRPCYNQKRLSEGESTVFIPYESPLKAFKSYRFSPHFAYSVPSQGLLSRTCTNRIRHDAPVCYYDLIGRCSRKKCPAQHFRSIFMDDPSILEDFLLGLLSMPIGSPFRDHVHLLTFIKEQIISKSTGQIPLISLVSIIIDTFRSMEGGNTVICFRRRPTAQLENELRVMMRTKRDAGSLEFPRIGKPRCFLSGISGIGECILPRIRRYFDSSDGFDDCLAAITDNPLDETHWLELFLLTLSRKNLRKREDLLEGLQVLRDALTAIPESELLLCVTKDFEALLGMESEFSKDPLSSLLLWYEFYSHVRATDFWGSFCQFIKEPLISSLASGAVRELCDRGQQSHGLALLCRIIFTDVTNDDLEVPALAHLVTSTDSAYLAMMYLYVRDFGTYPNGAYLSFPFEHVRRRDFFYYRGWPLQESFLDDFKLLRDILYGLDNADMIQGWIVKTLLDLATTWDIDSIGFLFSKDWFSLLGPTSVIILANSTNSSEYAALLKLLVPQNPVLAILIASSMLLEENHVDTIKSFVREFWLQFCGCSNISDDLLVVVIGRAMGVPELFDIVSMEGVDTNFITVDSRKDPFIWLWAAMSITLLSSMGTSYQTILAPFLELAASRIMDPLSETFLLICLRSICPEDVGASLDSRILASLESNLPLPQAGPIQEWEKYGRLEGPINEFVELDVEPADDKCMLLLDLSPDSRYPPEVNPVSVNVALRCHAPVADVLCLLAKNPHSVASWILYSLPPDLVSCVVLGLLKPPQAKKNR